MPPVPPLPPLPTESVRAAKTNGLHVVRGGMPMLTIGASDTNHSVTLGWDMSPDLSVTGYNIYYGSNSMSFQAFEQVAGRTTTLAKVGGLHAGKTYYFAATAIANDGLESAYSNEVVYTVPNGQPFIQIAIIAQAATAVEGPYTNYAVFPVLTTTNVALPMFFRANMTITTDGQSTASRYPNIPVIVVK